MKIKKVTFTHTGKYKKPEKNEWFQNCFGDYECNRGDTDVGEREIVTREEIFEDWKPKEKEDYEVISVIILEKRNNNSDYLKEDIESYGELFPVGTAQKKLSEIKKLLNP